MTGVVEQDIAESHAPVVGVFATNEAEVCRQLRQIDPRVDIRTLNQLGDPAQIEAIVCWKPPAGLLPQLTGLKLVQATGAGVDAIVAEPGLPPGVAVARTIDDDIAQGMAGYVSWAVLDHFRGMQHYRADQAQSRWAQVEPPSPSEHVVGFAGAGELGLACLRVVSSLGFSTRVWSRSPKAQLPAQTRGYTGESGLDDFLKGCDTLVCLLPLTAQTSGFLNRRVFDMLPRGAHVINVARGAHLVEQDLLNALDSGRIGRATLDVFATEPLPSLHPLWTHGKVVVTPHIAARASARVVAEQVIRNLNELSRGYAPCYEVRMKEGY